MAANRKAPPPSAAHAAHAQGARCERCGTVASIERSYDVNDRMLQMLVVAVCREMGIESYRKGSKNPMTLYVSGPDSATLDRLDSRVKDLAAKLDAELLKVTAAFVREHTGVELTAPRKA